MSKILLAVALAASASAFAKDFSCPERIKTKQSLVGKPAGWESAVDSGWGDPLIESVGFYDGKPEAILAPDNKDTEESRSRAVWTFEGKGPFGQVCRYKGSNVVLRRKLPAGSRKCEVKYDIHVHPGVKSVDCEVAVKN